MRCPALCLQPLLHWMIPRQKNIHKYTYICMNAVSTRTTADIDNQWFVPSTPPLQSQYMHMHLCTLFFVLAQRTTMYNQTPSTPFRSQQSLIPTMSHVFALNLLPSNMCTTYKVSGWKWSAAPVEKRSSIWRNHCRKRELWGLKRLAFEWEQTSCFCCFSTTTEVYQKNG